MTHIPSSTSKVQPPNVTTKANTTTELVLLLMLATFWGASYTFIRIGVATIPPITLIAARTLIAVGVLFAIVCWRRLASPREPAIWRRFLIQACLNSVIPFTLIAWAERTVDAGLATILNSTAPIFTFLLAAILFRNKLVTARKLFGIAMGLTGICFIIGFDTWGLFSRIHLPRSTITMLLPLPWVCEMIPPLRSRTQSCAALIPKYS